jgi:acyl-CoA synthetase (AMP-forming)/AMP-acid ligase II
MNLYELLSKSAASFPGRLALVQGQRTLDYGELLGAVGATAMHLSDTGVARGETVAIQMLNSIECVAAIFGAATLGASVLALDPTLKADEVETYCGRAGARTLLHMQTDAAAKQPSVPRRRTMPPLEALLERAQAVSASAEDTKPYGRARSAFLFLSSGTHWAPKDSVEKPRTSGGGPAGLPGRAAVFRE